MLTEEMVREGYFQRHGREMSQEDVEAFLKICKMFNCLDSSSYHEALYRVTEISLIKAGFSYARVSNEYVN
jgi:hypothetical protein